MEPAFWRPGYLHLFLSHISKHKKLAFEIQTSLAEYGVHAFVAHEDIEPTKFWQNEIEAALATADALVALLTPGFHESEWTDQELGFAMGRGILIISVRHGLNPYGFIAKSQGMLSSDKAENIARRLFEILLKHEQTADTMKSALVRLLEDSNTYNQTRRVMKILEKVTEWPTPLRKRILGALTTNDQVSDTDGVPERIKALIGPAKE